MKSILKILASSALIGFLLILPLMTMEVTNRRNYNEDFPLVLFFGMWEVLFAITLILLPLAQARRIGKHDLVKVDPKSGNSFLANPRSAAIVSGAIFLSLGMLALLDALGLIPLQSLLNGPDPEQDYIPGLLISIGIFWLAVMAVVIANVPVIRTLQDGGSLFAHPLNMIIVVLFVSFLAIGLTSLIVDQWPCFMGVPLCD